MPNPNPAMARLCPFTKCARKIRTVHFACVPHWRAIPKALQEEVYRIYREWQAGRMDGDELRTRQREIVSEVEQGS